ncbi:DUF397 domain-containing protein [Actinomadura atramentaria]|uniref:DUF397 domain-containing protein n=1 Tax=Actinomadura atramentaria TaxID=1990 RepID=UPI00037379A0|nr:DUF397 domain-containing protein [Actinomadura atramentaria]
MVDAQWRVSSYSGSGGGQCVEVAGAAGYRMARDSKDSAGPVLALPAESWKQFTTEIKEGRFDL